MPAVLHCTGSGAPAEGDNSQLHTAATNALFPGGASVLPLPLPLGPAYNISNFRAFVNVTVSAYADGLASNFAVNVSTLSDLVNLLGQLYYPQGILFEVSLHLPIMLLSHPERGAAAECLHAQGLWKYLEQVPLAACANACIPCRCCPWCPQIPMTRWLIAQSRARMGRWASVSACLCSCWMTPGRRLSRRPLTMWCAQSAHASLSRSSVGQLSPCM